MDTAGSQVSFRGVLERLPGEPAKGELKRRPCLLTEGSVVVQLGWSQTVLQVVMVLSQPWELFEMFDMGQLGGLMLSRKAHDPRAESCWRQIVLGHASIKDMDRDARSASCGGGLSRVPWQLMPRVLPFLGGVEPRFGRIAVDKHKAPMGTWRPCPVPLEPARNLRDPADVSKRQPATFTGVHPGISKHGRHDCIQEGAVASLVFNQDLQW